MSDPLERQAASNAIPELLAVEELDTDLYRGSAEPDVPGRVFGGQVIAQSLAAATASIGADQVAHSLHAYFLRAGDNTRPIIYRVLRDFDGRSFANRRVVALQDGKPILNLAASFQRPETGLSHGSSAPSVPGPEQAIPLTNLIQREGVRLPKPIANRLATFDIRAVMPDGAGAMHSQQSWFRLSAEIRPKLARISLAYVSDFGLVTTAMLPHGLEWFSPNIQGASLDHAIWFHEEPPLGEWLLYAMDSPWSGHARGFARGSVYDRSGRLIASVAQEGLMRQRTPA